MLKLTVNTWTAVRAFVVLLGVCGSNTLASDPQSFVGEASVTPPSIFFGFGAAAIVLIIGIQALNSRSAIIWTKPDWRANPFSPRQPLQFFHMSAYHFILMAVGAIVLARVKHLDGILPFLALALGIGILVGIRCCQTLYWRKFATE